MFGHTLRGWLAESVELVTSRTTFPYKITIWNLLILMVLLIIIGLTLLKVVIIKLSFICFYFFSMKSKTRALCLITVSLLTKPPWPSKHKISFCKWATSCGLVFCSEPVEKWFGLWKIQALESETSNFLIYRLTLNIGNFGSNASINDAWHKKVNNMEM